MPYSCAEVKETDKSKIDRGHFLTLETASVKIFLTAVNF